MNWSTLYARIGAAGVALFVAAAVALYLCVKYLIYLLWIGHVFRRRMAAPEAGSGPRKAPAATTNPLLRILNGAVPHAARGAEALRAEMAFLFHKHFRKINRAMTWLRLISVISPLLGLLGTVLGISKVFRVLGGQSAVNPALLAAGIWEALTTTILGLTITIPVLCFYYFFRLMIHGFQVELMENAGHAAPGFAVDQATGGESLEGV